MVSYQMKPYHKKSPVISYSEFMQHMKRVKEFTSSHGRRYEVDGLKNNLLFFRSLDAGGTAWDIDLEQLYHAYTDLETFETEHSRPYVPKRHSPGRDLLLHLGLID